MSPTAYPLTWPKSFPRSAKREKGAFKTSLAGAIKNVQSSLRLFASDSGKRLDQIVISSNYTLGQESPADPAVAVYFAWDGISVCIPVDRYESVAANLQAIHHILEARRVELRHGTLALVRAAFTGFAALPPPPDPDAWRTVLGFNATESLSRAIIDAAYKSLAKKFHPDKAPSFSPDEANARMAKINKAREQAYLEISE
jgi:hypothetical protein